MAGAGATLDKAAFSADLAVTGAQSGTVHITKTITDLTATSFSASAKLKLTKRGTVKIDIPSKFGLALSASGTVAGGPRRARWSPSPPRVALTVTVTEGSDTDADPDRRPPPSNGDTEDTSAAVDATGTPVGGAATGGGGTPGSDMPLAFGGIAHAPGRRRPHRCPGGGPARPRPPAGGAHSATPARRQPPDGPSGDSPGRAGRLSERDEPPAGSHPGGDGGDKQAPRPRSGAGALSWPPSLGVLLLALGGFVAVWALAGGRAGRRRRRSRSRAPSGPRCRRSTAGRWRCRWRPRPRCGSRSRS